MDHNGNKLLKTIDIVGDNYSGSWTDTRTACRGIVIKDGKLLLSFESLTGQWMIPGGGLEPGEDELTCCAREVEEETGLIVQPSDCALEIDEYYESFKWINRYFFCEVTGKTEVNLTEREKEVGMEPRWLQLGETIRMLSKHPSDADTDEVRCGMYRREYTALRELL